MSDEVLTVAEMRARLVKKATEDGAFRFQLLADPKATIKDELGVTIPDGYTVKVHEETLPDTSHLVLPPPARLAESEMEAAAGGQVYRWTGTDYVGTDNAITFWDDFNGPVYNGGPRHNAS